MRSSRTIHASLARHDALLVLAAVDAVAAHDPRVAGEARRPQLVELADVALELVGDEPVVGVAEGHVGAPGHLDAAVARRTWTPLVLADDLDAVAIGDADGPVH